jgi:hypothetical protein
MSDNKRDGRKAQAVKIGEIYEVGEMIILRVGWHEYQLNKNLFDHVTNQMSECTIIHGNTEGC